MVDDSCEHRSATTTNKSLTKVDEVEPVDDESLVLLKPVLEAAFVDETRWWWVDDDGVADIVVGTIVGGLESPFADDVLTTGRRSAWTAEKKCSWILRENDSI